MRAFAGGRFQHARAQALPAHLHQAEAGNAADLDPRPVAFQRVFQRAFDLPVVGVVLHVNEVDHHQAGHVAQAQLARDFLGRFEVGGQGRLLDPVFLGRTAGVDVDRDERLGRVDDQVAAALQLHDRVVHRAQLILRAIALEQGDRVGIGLHPPGVAGHQELHELLRRAVAGFALDHDFLDLAVVDVADRPLDQVAVRMDQRGGAGGKRLLADLVPQAREIVEVALDLGLGALEAGRADDQPHRARQLEIADDLLQPLAIAGAGNLARDAAAVAAVGHQHGVAAGEAEVGRQRGTLVAAFFLDHLDQQDLPALDHVLDLVAAAQRLAPGADLVHFLGPRAALALAAAATPAAAARTVAFFLVVAVVVAIVVAIRDLAFLDRGDLVLLGRVDFLDPVLGEFLDQRFAGLVVGVVLVARNVAAFLFLGAQARFFLGSLGLFGQELFAVFLRDLVVVGVDLAEGEEPVPVAAEIDEGRLEAGFDPGYLGEVDIALDLPMFGGFEIKFLDPVALEHRHPRFFRVARIDKHARCHVKISVRVRAGCRRPGSSAQISGIRRSPGDGRQCRTGRREPFRGAGMMCLQSCECACVAPPGPPARRRPPVAGWSCSGRGFS